MVNFMLCIFFYSKKIPIEGQPTKYLISTPENYQGQAKQGKFEKLSQPRGA